MATNITCPFCNKHFEPSDAYKHELEEKLISDIKAKYNEELIKLKKEKQDILVKSEEKLEEVKNEITLKARKDAINKVRLEYDAKIASTKEESKEQEYKNKELQEEIKKLFKELRETKDTKDRLEIEFQKKLFEEQTKIRNVARREVENEFNLEIAKKDKKMQDLQKQLQEAQRKAQVGSQQLQGELQELAFEKSLTSEFPFDKIREVPKGVNGADIIQEVFHSSGTFSGTIVWEIKNTKNWSNKWIAKLKQDKRMLKADLAVLVTTALPEGSLSFELIDGILVTQPEIALGLSHLLRQQIIQVHAANTANEGKSEKAEIVYNYLISNDFKQRIEVWVEYFKNRRDEIDKERAYYTKKWEKEDKDIVRVIQNTAGIYGDLQGLIGNALPKVSYLELSEGDKKLS
ncbi:DUF2130 domain-containing protein [Candidatus Woesebacteria bacterium]|nr:MAG: DUF2130 domain-containing protein [Candidatus Woesebacteria bacterium]